VEFEQGRIEDHTDMIRVGPPTRARIAELRAQGLGFRAIARKLNDDGVPTPSGRGQWYQHSVKTHLHADAWANYMRGYRARTTGPARSRARRR
jgi:hypothetical protein